MNCRIGNSLIIYTGPFQLLQKITFSTTLLKYSICYLLETAEFLYVKAVSSDKFFKFSNKTWSASAGGEALLFDFWLYTDQLLEHGDNA